MKCCQSFPIGRFREPCVECCALSQNFTLIFRPSYQASFSGVGRGDQLPSGEEEEGLTLEYVTGKKLCSNPCTVLELPQPRYLDLKHMASHAEGSLFLRCRLRRL